MNWIKLDNESQLSDITKNSYTKPQLIFKHSSRCSVSAVALSRLQNHLPEAPEIDYYFLDLIAYRSLSNKIAEQFSVYHESPQVLLIRNGECVYDESHLGISADDIVEQAL